MNESIESIWKDGFADDMTSLAPKINDLYNQKSQNLVDKFEHMFVVNQNAVLAAAVMILLVLWYLGAPFLAILIALMLSGLVLVGKQQLKELRLINKSVSCFEYLQAFEQWLEKAIQQYTRIYHAFYPALFLICGMRFLYSDLAASILPGYASEYLILGLPLVLVLPVALVAVVLGFAGGAIYRADVNLVYGQQIYKLKELIAEMKALRE